MLSGGQENVGIARRGHALKGIVKPQSAPLARAKKCERACHHAAAPPDAALDDVPWNLIGNDIVHRVPQGQNAFFRSHRVRPCLLKDLLRLRVHVSILYEPVAGLRQKVFCCFFWRFEDAT